MPFLVIGSDVFLFADQKEKIIVYIDLFLELTRRL